MFNELILEVNPTITAVATLLIGFTILALAAVTLILARAGKLKPTIV
jgi:ABC-type spermidine/putrescine transport system permease subunit II